MGRCIFNLLGRCFGGGLGFGGYLGRDCGRSDLHRRENLLEAAEDFVAVDVLGDAIGGLVRGDVQGELVAGSILEDMEVF